MAKTAVINVFIDPQNGFVIPDLPDEKGGSLYVPQGEDVIPLMGSVIESSKNAIFVIGQDYHPDNHISFMVNHPGVMEYRVEKFLRLTNSQFLDMDNPAIKESVYRQAQQPVQFINGQGNPPVLFPFDEIVLDEDRNIIGVQGQTSIMRASARTASGLNPGSEDRGRITNVAVQCLPKTFDEYLGEGRRLSLQTLWTKHCVQGTESSLYPDSLKLPKAFVNRLKSDLKSDSVHFHDAETGNRFYVIRKGGNSEIDSYGIGVENDLETETSARRVFTVIAHDLMRSGYDGVRINIGGLASNFCVEFSANNIDDFLAGCFKMRGMQVDLRYVPELSRGIPIPGGADDPFSLAGVEERLARRGIGTESALSCITTLSPA